MCTYCHISARVNTFKEMYPNLSLPPQPILTRWGTWLEAAIYYGKYFKEVKCVINDFNQNEAKCIENKHSLFHNKELKNELAVIITHFQCLIDTITKLEKSNVTLRDSLLLIENIKIKFEEGGPLSPWPRDRFR